MLNLVEIVLGTASFLMFKLVSYGDFFPFTVSSRDGLIVVSFLLVRRLLAQPTSGARHPKVCFYPIKCHFDVMS